MNTPVKGLRQQDAWNIQGNRGMSASPTAPRVIPGEAGERWHQAMQTWQAGTRTVICVGGLALGLSETREGEKTLDMGVFKRQEGRCPRGCWGWSSMKGSSRD